uniref:Hypothetical hydroxylase protein n=1 Tax=Renibacterium salmoninarum TaxID=1646 RepID=Q5UAZ9_RENSA|nr:hypothetical hydroxylase protein [Renibacterium salmoninarum]
MDENLWELPQLTIRRISVSSMDNNIYLLTSRRTGTQLLIDAADDSPAIFDLLAVAAADVEPGTEAKLAAVFTTHSHWDHVRALAEVVAQTGARTVAGTLDAATLQCPLMHPYIIKTFASSATSTSRRSTCAVTPRASIALLYQDSVGPAHLFTGDSLFPGGVGNTENDPARFEQLLNDVTERIFERLPDDTIVNPGHGKGTTLGAERPQLASWRARGW